MTSARQLFPVVLIAAGVVVLDQVTKSLVTARIDPGEAVDVLGPLRLTLTHNDGIAFGLAGGGGVFLILIALVALVALGAFIAAAPARPATALAGGLILGGAIGNLIDRVRLGHVTDFILLPHWPAFNIADFGITVGVIMLAATFIFPGTDHGADGSNGEADRPEDEANGG